MTSRRAHNPENDRQTPSSAVPLAQGDVSTETIDLQSLFTRDLTESGSFDIRGGLWTTTFGKLVQALPIPAMLVDRYHAILVANQAWRKFGGNYQDLLKNRFKDVFLSAKEAARGEAVLNDVFEKRKAVSLQTRLSIWDSRIWARMIFRCLRIGGERFVLVLIEDLTAEREKRLAEMRHREELEREIAERRRVESAVLRSKREWELTFDAIPDLIALIDEQHRIVRLNRAMADWLSIHPREAIGKHCYELCHQTDRPVPNCPLNGTLADGKEHSIEIMEGERGQTFLVSVTPLRDPEEGTTTYVHVARDFTEQKRLEDRLRNMATTDGLTGLYNLRHFRMLSVKEMDRGKRYGHPLALMILDLDHFKAINDEHGHDVGDRVLQRIAQIGRASLRESDVFARLGGDEFAALLPETDLWQALVVAERLRKKVAEALVSTETGSVRFTVSAGVAEAKGGELDLDRLMKYADSALYSAKSGGRNRVEAHRASRR